MKSTKILFLELFIGLLLGGIFSYFAFQAPTKQDRRNLLKKENLTPIQIDSTINAEDDDFLWTLMLLSS